MMRARTRGWTRRLREDAEGEGDAPRVAVRAECGIGLGINRRAVRGDAREEDVLTDENARDSCRSSRYAANFKENEKLGHRY